MKSNKFAALGVVAAAAIMLALPGTAEAYPKQGWYTGVAGGVGILEDSDATFGGITNKFEFKPGFAISGSVGYGFENQLRPEFEIAYRRNVVDQISGVGAGSGTGNFNTLAFMGNLLYDFNLHNGLTPYIGGGLGLGLVGADGAGNFIGGQLDSEKPRLAYQGIVGVSYEIYERLDFTADYRYFGTMEPEFNTRTGITVDDTSFTDHTFMVGLRYIYGVPKQLPAPVAMRTAPRMVNVVQAPMLPPPPVVQAPPPPPVPAVPETYIVFFDFDKYYLTSEAKETLQRAADAFKRGGVARVEVTGHTDTMGSNRYNQRLSERRARVTREYMVSLGVPNGEINTRGAGESELMVPTGNQVREARNRRAEIILRQ